jgi:cyclic pyranopterin phosphate synthase
MIDQYGRNIEYLRLSITENCNLKCIYCNPDGMLCSPVDTHQMALEDIVKTVRAMVRVGIRKVRITGGEPTIRTDLVEIVRRISALPGIEDLSMTTNGLRLEALADELKRAGLHRLNISLDSLDPLKFEEITGGGKLESVLAGIDHALAIGLQPIKINTVMIRGINDNEISALIALAKDRPIDIRFIELMPIGHFGESKRETILTSDEVLAKHTELKPLQRDEQGAPAVYYGIDGYLGRIGFISPISHEFCDDCNRIRVTADGKIRPCLGHNGEVDIQPFLNLDDETFDAMIADIIFRKPRGHHFNTEFNSKRTMNKIGG